MPRKAKAPRSCSKRSLPTQHTRRHIEQEPADHSVPLSTRTVSIQNRSREPVIMYRDHVSAFLPSSTLNSTANVNTKTVRFTRHYDEHANTPHVIHSAPSTNEVNASFPPRVSSRQQIATPEEKISFRKVLTGNAIPATKDLAVTEELWTYEEGQQAHPQSCQVSVESVSTRKTDTDHNTTATSNSLMRSATPTPEKTTIPMATLAEVTAAEEPSAFTTLSTTTKPIQPSRNDSGVGPTQQVNTIQSLSTTNLCRSPLGGTVPGKKRRSENELASWLAISNMLDRL